MSMTFERLRAAKLAARDAGYTSSAKFDGSGVHGRRHVGNIIGWKFVAACGLSSFAYEQECVEVPDLCRRCCVAIEKEAAHD